MGDDDATNGKTKTELVLSYEERQVLERLTRRRKSDQAKVTA
jgi:hypothetical protein